MEDDKKKPVTPVPAATVLLIRDTDQGLEVFMVERNNRMHFASALVFPGGLVDPEDSEERLLSRCDGIEGLSADSWSHDMDKKFHPQLREGLRAQLKKQGFDFR